MKYEVLPTGLLNQSYTYEFDSDLKVGDLVKIPLRSRNVVGCVTGKVNYSPIESIKKISEAYSFSISEESLEFLDWVSGYTTYPKGQILKMFLGEISVFKSKKKPVHREMEFKFSEISLNEEQTAAFEKIKEAPNKTTLLHGMTGAGKTEVYLKYAQEFISQGNQVLILFPEIALTAQMTNRIEKYLGVTPMIWNSSISVSDRKSVWATVETGKSSIIVGTRSALFLPFKNLGLIVVDEEHDSSYKQNEKVLYNGRDMAVVLGKILNIPVILSSATPSLESYVNSKSGKYNYAPILNRFANVKVPHVEIIDMRKYGANELISSRLCEKISYALKNKEQVMLYLNRRGFAPIVLCKECGEKFVCPDCSAFLAMHKNKNLLICHMCGYSIDISRNCNKCGSKSIIIFGAGVEKVYEEVTQKFPEYNSLIASSDTMNSSKNIEAVLNAINGNQAQIIISTQILAKGHHFKNLSTIGIIDGDFGLDRADIRALEKNYQLLYQVFGRAGRETNNGQVFIQTFEPANPVFENLRSYDQENFFKEEIKVRNLYNNPPFSRMVAIIISGNNERYVKHTANIIAEIELKNALLLGPVPAPISKIRRKTRWRILVKSAKSMNIQKILSEKIKNLKIDRGVNVQIDVDPINFL